MKISSHAARCAALAAAGALTAACSTAGSGSLAPSTHQNFGASPPSIKLLVVNATSTVITTAGFSSKCWAASPSLPKIVAAGTTSQPVTLSLVPYNVGCSPTPTLRFDYSPDSPSGSNNSECEFFVDVSYNSEGDASFYFQAIADGATTCTAKWSNSSDGEILTYAPG